MDLNTSDQEIIQISNLPWEDSVWFIEFILDDGDSYLQIVDKYCRSIGHIQENLTCNPKPEDILNCFIKACLFPCKGSARRPRHIVLKGELLEQFLDNTFLCESFDQLGIALAGSKATRSSGDVRWRECHFCHVRAEQRLLTYCPMCKAVLYCSTECQNEDTHASSGLNSHGFWCSKFLSYMEDAAKLSELPFEFSSETCSSDFDASKYRSFLKDKGVFGEGCWRREGLMSTDEAQKHQYGKFIDLDNPYVLPVESCMLDDPPTVDSESSILNWGLYYESRGLDLSSPIAILLQWPLTVFFIIKYLMNVQEVSSDFGHHINIDIIGVEKEVELIPVFKELGNLLGDIVIDIHLFGRHLHHHVREKVWTISNVTITVHNQLYHKHSSQHRAPHLVIGFNAGLAAYSSWIPTIKELKDMKVPAFFTDYCRSSIELSRLMLRDHCNIKVSDPVLNPFRSPIRTTSSDHDLPWFSNAYIFCLEYT